MLPFLKPKKAATVYTASYSSGGETKPTGEEGEHPEELMFAAQDLISAVHAKDAQAVASALKAFHEMNEAKEDFLAPDEG